MEEVLEYEYNQFLHDMKDGAMTFGRYLDETEYEEEFSRNEIKECQMKFLHKVCDYLREHFPKKYVVKGGWCIFVMTVEEAKARKIQNIPAYVQ